MMTLRDFMDKSEFSISDFDDYKNRSLKKQNNIIMVDIFLCLFVFLGFFCLNFFCHDSNFYHSFIGSLVFSCAPAVLFILFSMLFLFNPIMSLGYPNLHWTTLYFKAWRLVVRPRMLVVSSLFSKYSQSLSYDELQDPKYIAIYDLYILLNEKMDDAIPLSFNMDWECFPDVSKIEDFLNSRGVFVHGNEPQD